MTKKKRGRPPKAPSTEALSTGFSADVVAIMKLIDHAKAQGLLYFEGPQGVKFGFRREAQKPLAIKQAREVGDDFIP